MLLEKSHQLLLAQYKPAGCSKLTLEPSAPSVHERSHCSDTPMLKINCVTFWSSASLYQPVKWAVNLPHRLAISCWWMKIPVTGCQCFGSVWIISLKRAPSQHQPLQDNAVRETLKSCPFFSFKERFIEALAARRLMDKRAGSATV